MWGASAARTAAFGGSAGCAYFCVVATDTCPSIRPTSATGLAALLQLLAAAKTNLHDEPKMIQGGLVKVATDRDERD